MNITRGNTLISPIQLIGGLLQLTQEVVDCLGAKVGDKVCVRFDNNATPILALATAIGEDNGGNLIRKTLAVSCRGKTGTVLAAFGGKFDYKLEAEGYLVLTPFTAEIAEDPQIEEIQSNQPDQDLQEVNFDYLKG